MSFRITTNGVFRNYRANLQKSTKKMRDTMSRVETQRAFASYAEDSNAASKSFQTRRAYWRADDQIDNSNYLISKFQTGWGALDWVVDGNDSDRDLSGIKSSLAGVTDTAGSSRNALGVELINKAESIMKLMNVQYGDEFVFAGSDGLTVPFTNDENGNLLYRGIPVDVKEGSDVKNFGDEAETDDAYYQKLKAFNQDATYVDIGLGLKEQTDGKGNLLKNDDGSYKIDPASAFNSALSGISFLGYGLDADGDPKNLVSLMKELGEIFSDCDSGTGEYASKQDEEDALRLVGKLNSAIDYTINQHVDLTASSAYLDTNLDQLVQTRLTLNEQIEDLEQIDPAEAITEMMWAQYCYTASLQVGGKILSQSLMDYLN